MNARNFADTLRYPIVFWAGNGAPSGNTNLHHADWELPFDLSEISGEVDEGVLEADNLNDGTGAFGWKFSDHQGNLIYKVQVFDDQELYEKLLVDWLSSIGEPRESVLAYAKAEGVSEERFAELYD